MKSNGTMVRAFDFGAAGREIDSRVDTVHPAFYSFVIDKMSTKFVWKLKTEGFT